MKTSILLLALIFIGGSSCNRMKEVEPIDTSVNTKIGWKTIDLNIDYTIQFPADTYDGSGYRLRTSKDTFGDKGTLIDRKDQQASLSATFCNPSAYPCLLIQYYDSLKIPLPKSVPFRNSKGEDTFMNNRITFGKDNKLFAVLYYGINPGVKFRPYEGYLYTVSRESGLPQRAGSVGFSDSTKQEILDILSTITPKY